MKDKYERYIEYIANDLEIPYFKNMSDSYGLRPDEYEMVLSKVFNQPVSIEGNDVYDIKSNIIYYEASNGYWVKKEYDTNGNLTYFEDSDGDWIKKEYDANGEQIYYEYSDGVIIDNR